MTGSFSSRTVVVSGGGSTAGARRTGNTAAGTANDNAVNNWRRVCVILIGSFLSFR